jgi:hypothetical protein
VTSREAEWPPNSYAILRVAYGKAGGKRWHLLDR